MKPLLHHQAAPPFNTGPRPGRSVMRRLPLYLSLCLALLLLQGCTEQASPKVSSLPVVSLEEVKLSETGLTMETTGLVKPWKEARLSFQVPGKIRQGPTDEGAAAGTGSVLARLDEADYRAQGNSARHQLELARLETERTLADLQRAERLYDAEAIPEKDLEDARFAHRAAVARAGQAESALQQAELALAHCILKAPFAGEVLKKLAEQGEMVAAGTPVLVLGQLDPVKVSVTVAAREVDAWPVGSEALVIPDPVTGNVETGGSGTRKAVVHNVSPVAEGYTGSFEVVLKLDNPGRDLRPGQVVGVERRVKTAPALWIPLKSVVSRGEELKYVFIYQPGDGTVKQQPVTLDGVSGDRVRVIEGLAAGDRVVVMMPGDLKDGARVEVKENGAH